MATAGPRPGTAWGRLGASGLTSLADSWGLVLTYGLVTLGLAGLLLAWPDETLKVCAVLIALQLLVAGVVRLVSAFVVRTPGPGGRVLIGASGVLAIVVGLLCLREPLQTVLVIGLVLGVWWMVSGALDISGALLSDGPGRGGQVLAGAVSLVAGLVLLVWPDITFRVLYAVICAWLLVIGVLAIGTALHLRARRTAPPAARATDGPTPLLGGPTP